MTVCSLGMISPRRRMLYEYLRAPLLSDCHSYQGWRSSEARRGRAIFSSFRNSLGLCSYLPSEGTSVRAWQLSIESTRIETVLLVLRYHCRQKASDAGSLQGEILSVMQRRDGAVQVYEALRIPDTS